MHTKNKKFPLFLPSSALLVQRGRHSQPSFTKGFIGRQQKSMELSGFEPLTPSMPLRCSTN